MVKLETHINTHRELSPLDGLDWNTINVEQLFASKYLLMVLIVLLSSNDSITMIIQLDHTLHERS